MRTGPARVILAMVVASLPTTAPAVDYPGEFCWQRSNGNLIRVGVTHVGDGHFQLNGRKSAGTDLGTTPLHRAAEIEGDQVYLVMNFAGENLDRIWTRVTSSSARARGTKAPCAPRPK